MSRFVKLLARWCGLAALALASATAAAQTPQTITFASISTKTYGSAPFAVSATASSGLAVVVTSNTTGVCTVSGSTVTLVAAGNCTQVTRTFSVTKASQTITFASLGNRTWSATPFTITGTASSALPVAFATTTPTICGVATDGGGITRVTMLIAGTCTVTANQAGDGTYNAATQVSRSFTISKAAQTLTIGTIATKNVGDADFQPEVTNSAGLAYTLGTTTAAVCTVASNAVTIVTTGTCTIQANAPATPTHNAATQQSRNITVAAARAPVVYYVHPDQIGTPRVMTRASTNAVVWRWDNEEAFGDNQPNEMPGGAGEKFKYDLRFAGQVRDTETSTNYNYFRDYNPALGSYVQSDPIGLQGGINTYAYVDGNPLSYADPYGLYSWDEFVDDSANFSAGWGDMLSLGLTARIRQSADIGSVNYCSASYVAGSVAGFANSIPIGWALGSRIAAAKGLKTTETLFKRNHYRTRLEAAGVNIPRAEAAVSSEINAMRGNMVVNADVVGRLTVDGVKLEFRTRLLTNGRVAVGTLFPVK